MQAIGCRGGAGKGGKGGKGAGKGGKGGTEEADRGAERRQAAPFGATLQDPVSLCVPSSAGARVGTTQTTKAAASSEVTDGDMPHL